jgi:hypothetical protein
MLLIMSIDVLWFCVYRESKALLLSTNCLLATFTIVTKSRGHLFGEQVTFIDSTYS